MDASSNHQMGESQSDIKIFELRRALAIPNTCWHTVLSRLDAAATTDVPLEIVEMQT